MNWIKDREDYRVFTCTEVFNDYTYIVEIFVEDKKKSSLFWVGISSGKKRKELKIFENKNNKSLGGIKALLWIKKAILYFPEYYKNIYNIKDTKLYICIDWADNRRRNIYQRLEKEGFYFMQIDGSKSLIKQIN